MEMWLSTLTIEANYTYLFYPTKEPIDRIMFVKNLANTKMNETSAMFGLLEIFNTSSK